MAQGLVISARALFSESLSFRLLLAGTAAFTALALIAQFGQKPGPAPAGSGSPPSAAPSASSAQPAFATQPAGAGPSAAAGPAFNFGNPTAAGQAPAPVTLQQAASLAGGAPPPPRASPMLRGVPFDELRK